MKLPQKPKRKEAVNINEKNSASNWSVDDILSEIEEKKTGPKPRIPALPNDSDDKESLTAELASIERRRFGEEAAPAKPKPDLSVTQILSSYEAKPDKSSSPDLSVTQILAEEKEKSDVVNTGEVAVEKIDVIDADESVAEKAAEKPFEAVKPVRIKRFNPQTNTEKSKKKQKATNTKEVAALPSLSAENEQSDESPTKQSDTKKILQTVVIDAVPLSKPNKPTYLLPEEKERLQKLREEELLEKEMALEDPDEMLDSINPYDVKNIETPVESELINVKLTLDIEPENNDVKPAKKSARANDVKEYKPSFEVEKWQKKHSKKIDFDEELNITPVLESLNKTFVEKRKSDLNVRRTLNVDTLSSVAPEANYKGKAIPAKLNIDYKKQILEDSAVLPPSSLHSKQLEARALGGKKKRKVRDFIFEDIDDDDDYEYENDQAHETSDEYEGYDSSDIIRRDLEESHKGLKWRFVLLLLITLVLTLFTFVHDIYGIDSENPILRRFNGDFTSYATVYVYANLIAGVIGMCLCSAPIIRGLKNLFTKKADCDSACAVPIIITTTASITHIVQNESTELLKFGEAHVYVSVALCALLFNTIGKIFMIVRAKKNFRFISGDSTKYSAFMPDLSEESDAYGFTKGILSDTPAPVFMKKTEFLTDYLKNSYCTDWADRICRRLVPISALIAVLMGVVAYFLPVYEAEMARNFSWAATAVGAFISVLSPFSIMFLVNNPLLRASNALAKNDCVVMGCKAAEKFSQANAVVVDAGVLFPAGSVKFLNAKRCQKPNAINSITIDESIVISASLAIKTNSIMSSMFYDMISGDSDLLYKIENPIYEVNMGITGWMGSKRIMLGNREQMKHHGVDIPGEQRERKYCPVNAEVVYLAVGSEAVAMFFIEVVRNPAVKNSLHELDINGFVLSVKTKDSLVTVAKLADIFELDPTRIRILSFDQHSSFDEYSRYTSRGSSEIACNGTFTSFSKALVTAKALIRDMTVTITVMFMTIIVAILLGIIFMVFSVTGMLSASAVIIYNVASLAIIFILQGLRRY